MSLGGSTATVAIIGGGASGTLAALHLIRTWRGSDPLRIVMYDVRGRPGHGAAYDTEERCHLLNVPAARMSALADDDAHFLRWLRRADPVPAETFVDRTTYGRYLAETLADHVRDTEFVLRRRPVTDVVRSSVGFQIRSGHEVDHVHGVVLALGNPPPAPLVVDGKAVPEGPRYIADPWKPGATAAARQLAGNGSALLVGSGLTAVDVAMSLSSGTARGPHVTAISRHGMLPRRHVTPMEAAWPVTVPPGDHPLTLAEVEAVVSAELSHARAANCDWRTVVDGLRPHIGGLWSRLPIAERRRFLAGPARIWDVHRHRMAPAIGAVVDELMRRGYFEVRAARLVQLQRTAAGWRATLAGRDGVEQLDAAVLVNCTGPELAAGQGSDLLVTRLVARGLARFDPLGLGLETDASGGVVGATGVAQPDLFTLGPPRRGQLWESTAVPEIRSQAHALSVRLDSVLTAARSPLRLPVPVAVSG
jgi:uncharacterized NAD(P)/FAD-binding protein YdhS